ncbi:MAG: molybdopterin-guanine dinucleotide biosynthesis protein B [Desulfotignum sp.]|nr:molybdopterin-guanine dinucleotide biosynthesis protein B [Desulfotignum sp.]
MIPPIISISGKSNTGKTTFLVKLIAELTQKGYRIGSAKHTHHDIDLDRKGKDSWRHKQAGARATLVITDHQIAMVKDDHRTDIEKMHAYLQNMDLILAEGFKRQALPKIEIFRTDGPHDHPLFLDHPDLIALVTDAEITPSVPVFGLEDIESVAAFIQDRFLN